MADNTLRTYLTQLWGQRHFLFSLVERDLRSRYQRSTLGMSWTILQPLALTAVMCMVFPAIFKVPVREFAPYLLVGLSFWSYFSTCALNGCACLVQGEPFIRQFPAPMAIYPLRVVLVAGVHFLIMLVVALGVVAYLNGLNLAVIGATLPLTLVLLFVLGWSVAVLFALANTYFRDVQHLADVFLQLLFYATPILYPVSLAKGFWFAFALRLNPLTALVELLRQPILLGKLPDLEIVVIAVAATLLLFGAATGLLAKLERRLIYQL